MSELNNAVLSSVNPGAVVPMLNVPKQVKAAKIALDLDEQGQMTVKPLKRAKPRKRAPVKPKQAEVVEPKDKQAKSVVNCFIYPNKGKNEVDTVKVTLNEKKVTFPALSKAKLDIASLDVSGLVKSFFIGLNSPKLADCQFVYKNAYSVVFGLGEVRPSSYKCVIANHLTDGLSTLVFNQSKPFQIDQIKSALSKADLSFIPKATYCYVTLSKDNLVKVIKMARGLLKLGKQA